jgi:(R,R)-butanediol dehydrogenase / meso-butanediol dehydrogenase / diacetyl reductase
LTNPEVVGTVVPRVPPARSTRLRSLMLAARWHGRRDIRVEQVADPGAPPPGWVRLRIDACGICGTDVEEYQSGPVLVPLEPHPLSQRCAPLILGHEPSGTVDAVGDGVRLDPGTRVAVETNMHCGECWWCLRGDTQLCTRLASLGLMGDGGLAEVMLAPASMCAPLPGHVPAAHGAMAEPLSVAVRALRRSGLRPGGSIAVVGSGTVGLLTVQVARRHGAETVIAVDALPRRRRLALELGATHAVAPDEAEGAIRDATGGVGVDVAVEAAGNARAALAAIAITRRGGRTVLLGVYDDVIPIAMFDLLINEREVIASLSHTFADDFVPAVRLIGDGAVELDPLITDRIPLAGVVERGFQPLVEDPTAHLKVIVIP